MDNGPSVIPQSTTQHSNQIEENGNVVYHGGNSVCLVVSNDNVNYQLIQIPSESVLVVGTDETGHQTYQTEPTISEPLEDVSQEVSPEVPTDHNADYFSQAFCKECNQYCGSNTALKTHNTHKHKGVYTCGICWRGFNQPTDLKRHTLTHYRKQFSCVMCDAAFCRPSTLKLHIANKHQHGENICMICGVARGTGGAEHVCYRCVECRAVFRTRTGYETHSCELRKRSFKCPYCGEKFTRNQGLVDHMLNEENKRGFECVVCKDRFNTKAQLRRHERIHVPEEWFKCKICGNKYATASGFRSHNIRQHKGHEANSIPARTRIDKGKLRKRAPHRHYRDDAVQTNTQDVRSSASQTLDTAANFIRTITPKKQYYRRNKYFRQGSSSPHFTDISPTKSLTSSPPSSPMSSPIRDGDSLNYSHNVSPLSERTIYMDDSLLKCNEEIIIDTDFEKQP